jgi:hypothetical protein
MRRLSMFIAAVAVALPSLSQTKMFINKGDGTCDSLWLYEVKSITFKVYPVTPTDGLVAYYPLNGNAHDESGNGNNGVVSGPTLSADRFGNADRAYSFDGTTNNIHINGSPSFAFTGTKAFTISCWVKVRSYSHQAVAFKGAASTPPYYNEWAVVIEPDTTLRVKVNADSLNSSYSYLTSSRALKLNQWSHLVATWNGNTQIMKLILDGQQIGSVSAVSQMVSMPNTPLHLGYVGDGPFGGELDDVRIYNRSLSDVEIQSLYHEGGW